MIRKIIIIVTILPLLMCISCHENNLPVYYGNHVPSVSKTVKDDFTNIFHSQSVADNNKILVLALIASVFSSLLLFYQLMRRHKKERLLDTYAAETRLSRKIHDEISNEIYGALHFLENEEVLSGVKKERLINQLDNIYLLTRNISRETNDIDVGLRYPVQLKLMLASYGDANVNIIIKGIPKINWDIIESTKKIALYRVLQELMVNMQKHSEATVVLVDFSIEKKKIKVIYSDNGKGSECNTLNLKNGLQNVENRIEAIGGKVIFDAKSEKGFHLTINFIGS